MAMRALIWILTLVVVVSISGCIGKGECWWWEGKQCWWFNEQKMKPSMEAPSTKADNVPEAAANITTPTEKEKPEEETPTTPYVPLGCG